MLLTKEHSANALVLTINNGQNSAGAASILSFLGCGWVLFILSLAPGAGLHGLNLTGKCYSNWERRKDIESDNRWFKELQTRHQQFWWSLVLSMTSLSQINRAILIFDRRGLTTQLRTIWQTLLLGAPLPDVGANPVKCKNKSKSNLFLIAGFVPLYQLILLLHSAPPRLTVLAVLYCTVLYCTVLYWPG